MNIANFIEWFITSFINIGSNLLSKLDNIYIYGNVSLLNFIVTIFIIELFLGIILTIPQTANRIEKRKEKIKNDK